ncbi:hypothetical protein KP509_27G017700 [Ceratopteris richardii]|uniref:Uncharacterized protein n=1 Tax=Ceratopteris richardii TaxID=49495 RepID=A0A8T2RG15_CERRI|nr:hypothetical protein KP509_27G017700 [Ceratopteris richardii]
MYVRESSLSLSLLSLSASLRLKESLFILLDLLCVTTSSGIRALVKRSAICLCNSRTISVRRSCPPLAELASAIHSLGDSFLWYYGS